MNFEYSDKVKELRARVQAFMEDHIYPVEKEVAEFNLDPKNNWTVWPGIEA